jgi:imidazolonepropionase-like amidohydrolase
MSVSGGSDSSQCCGGHSQSLARVCDGVPQVLKAVREEIKCGADCGRPISPRGLANLCPVIKLMVGGGVASEADPINMLQFTPEEIRAVTTTCKQIGNKLGMRVLRSMLYRY